jgi:hypothetical protein
MEGDSLIQLHTKVDTLIDSVAAVVVCVSGDPKCPESTGLKGIVKSLGVEIVSQAARLEALEKAKEEHRDIVRKWWMGIAASIIGTAGATIFIVRVLHL